MAEKEINYLKPVNGFFFNLLLTIKGSFGKNKYDWFGQKHVSFIFAKTLFLFCTIQCYLVAQPTKEYSTKMVHG